MSEDLSAVLVPEDQEMLSSVLETLGDASPSVSNGFSGSNRTLSCTQRDRLLAVQPLNTHSPIPSSIFLYPPVAGQTHQSLGSLTFVWDRLF